MLKRLLRSPVTISIELLSVAVLGAVGSGLPSPGDRAAWAASGRLLGALGTLLRIAGFADVFGSWLLVGVLALAVASLTVVLREQVGRARRAFRPLDERGFRSAALRAEFERPRSGAATRFETVRRAGSLGSAVFHGGLLVVVIAGIIRALFAADAQVDALAGEVLPAGPAAFAAQWRGPLAKPVGLANPLVLREVRPTRYPSGELEGLLAVMEERRPDAIVEKVVRVNSPLELEGGDVYVSALHGPAALLRLAPGAGKPWNRQVVLLAPAGGRRFEKQAIVGDGALYLRLRAVLADDASLPAQVDVRALAGAATAYAGSLAVGQTVALAPDGALALDGTVWWLRISATRDPSRPLAYAGFAAVLLGALLLFAFIRVDTMVAVAPAGDVERVVVALRAERLTQLFKDRFDALVRREGGSPA